MRIVISEHVEKESETYSAVVCYKEAEDAQASVNDFSRDRKEVKGLRGCLKLVPEGDNVFQYDSLKNDNIVSSDSDDTEDPFYKVNHPAKVKEGRSGKALDGYRARAYDQGKRMKDGYKEQRPASRQRYDSRTRERNGIYRNSDTEVYYQVKRKEEDLEKEKEEDKANKALEEAKKEMILQRETEKKWMIESYLGMELDRFLRKHRDEQRTKLAQLLFPHIKEIAEKYAPRIVAMLVDLSKFEVREIIEFVDNKEMLREKIDEAIEQIDS